ncbi:Putative neutral zinc metallopeptidase [Acididesulfobacillus acetoxydans]|uniref:Neutral zinc metallopeptidase n=1 Tax=Acididesulfobacillus acetoxydans TaxID=1561005 RepID=A0A8S0X6R1_9FIRM|nr:zinc metallopeptidase [Acididesulfobacillus acetoxydans]CAA7602760.1 Putative neutral zinc metallopeptidase [Acididesulfobacillus acetoxydans]CEJ06383.1 Peptidase membrane zinc metallopeptidase [Acididesulfobacillus acetoxydans]
MFFYDPTMILLIPAILLSVYAQAKISSAYGKYSEIRARSGLTGAQVARAILGGSGLYDVRVEAVSGRLSDHYDPRTKVVSLSQDVYSSNSLAAVAVAAHETGHALQDARGYFPLQLRSTFVPVANFGSSLGPILILVGLFMPAFGLLLQVGILFFAFAVLFQLITLPVEFNASHRALAMLSQENLVAGDEMRGARAVLSAAALTYVAAALAAVLQLARFVLIAQGRSRRD